MKNRFSNRTVQLSIAIFVIFTIMAFVSPGTFLSATNFKSVVVQISDIGLFALAMSITMMTGGIDLSIINLANLVAVVNAVLIKGVLSETSSTGETTAVLFLCLGVSLVIGFFAGALNAFLIANLKIPEILTTLGTMNLFFGAASIITKGQGIIGFPQQLLDIGANDFLGIPIPFIIFAVVAAFLFIIIHMTPYGSKLFLFGSNRKASYFSGINNSRVVYKTYIISSIIAALGGIMIMARTNSATIDYGSSLILITLLIGVLSGISPSGGTGNVINLVLALVVMQLLNSGLNLLRISSFIRETTPAVLLVFIMSLEFYMQMRSQRKLNKDALKIDSLKSNDINIK